MKNSQREFKKEEILSSIDEDYYKNNGLTNEQVNELKKYKFTNTFRKNLTESYLWIIFRNLFNWFNIILISLAVVFLIVGVGWKNSEYGITKYMFLLPVFINITIGLVQEIKAKKTVDKLKILNIPKVKVIREGEELFIDQEEVVLFDLIILERGVQVPVDGLILDGFISLNESLLTGEQKEKKHDIGENILAGTIVNSGSAKIKALAVGEDTYSFKLKNDIVKQRKPKSEMTGGVRILVLALSILVIPFAVITGYTAYNNFIGTDKIDINSISSYVTQNIAVEVGTTIIGAIPTGLVLITSARCAVSILELYKKNMSIKDLSAVEGLAYSNVVCFDKTGTLTTETMKLESIDFFDNDPDSVKEHLSVLIKNVPDNSETINAIRRYIDVESSLKVRDVIPFSSSTKFSGCHFDNDTSLYALGAPQFLLNKDDKILDIVKKEAEKGFRVLVFVKKDALENIYPLALVKLSDEIRPNAYKSLELLVKSNVQVKIISGDDPLTVSYIAHRLNLPGWDKVVNMQEIGPDADLTKIVTENTIFGRTTPEQKRDLIVALNKAGKKTTMVIDALNDLLAAKAANCSICISHKSGASAATQIADVTILDGDFDHLPDLIKEGRKSINSMERSSTLFLMKSFMTLGLSAFSPLFGHLPYSIEGLYVVTGCIIGLGGTLLGLEDCNEEIKGHFLKNVLSRAIPAGIFMCIPVIAVQLLCYFGVFPYAIYQTRFEGTMEDIINLGGQIGQGITFKEFNILLKEATIAGKEARNILLNATIVLEEPVCILTACIAAMAVMARTCMPLNKYRLMVLGICFGFAFISIIVLPNIFLGMDFISSEHKYSFVWIFSKDSNIYYIGGYPLIYSWLIVFFIVSFPLYSLFRNFSDRFIFRTTNKFEKIFQKVDFSKDNSIQNSFESYSD